MKRLTLLVFAFIATLGTLSAQNYIVVDSEKIFKSLDDYNTAIASLDRMAEEYQQRIDDEYEAIASLYAEYKAQEATLSAYLRQQQQNTILSREEAIEKFQRETFGPEGTLMKKRLELIQPIQKRVFEALSRYAAAKGYDLILDSASNPTLLYHGPKTDHTQALIEFIKR
ncbi:MAG: OmpH family outer membrane protein [Alistipes sp.]|nr:OmpH family outer membrane protein [Alistipes sp.]MDE7070260.1 OmpH family outer membrane protein [Alistipes sp.]